MATSKCPNCQSETLEIKDLNPQDAQLKLTIQCAQCGAVVSELGYQSLEVNKLILRLGYRL